MSRTPCYIVTYGYKDRPQRFARGFANDLATYLDHGVIYPEARFSRGFANDLATARLWAREIEASSDKVRPEIRDTRTGKRVADSARPYLAYLPLFGMLLVGLLLIAFMFGFLDGYRP